MIKKVSKKILFTIFVLIMLITPSSLSSDSQKNEEKTIENSFDETFDDSYFSDIIISDVKGGTNLVITIKNKGDLIYNNIEVETIITGGLVLSPRTKTHEIILLSADEPFDTEVFKNNIFGIGVVQVSIELDIYGNKKVIGQIKTLVMGPFVIILDTILNEKTSYYGYNLFTPEISKNTYLISNTGHIVHSWKTNYIQGMATYLLENGNLIRSDSSKAPHPNFLIGGFTGHVGIYEPDGSTVWDFIYSNSEYCLHHDLEPLPNGNILMIAAELIDEEEAIENGRNPDKLNDRRLCVDKIIEVEPIGRYEYEIVWEWHVWDHLIQDFDPEKENYGQVADHPELIDLNFGVSKADWTHVNSVEYDEDLDQILLCSRELDEIWIIDHSTTTEEAAGHSGGRYGKGGDLLYRWGNPQTYRAGDEDDQQLFTPHNANWIESDCPGAGNILVYNNKNEIEDETHPSLKFYSSVIEIIPPLNFNGNYYKIGASYGPNKPTWLYYREDDPHDFYSYHLSSAQRLPNGNTLICEGAKGKFFEVTPEKGIVWEYTNPYATPNHVFRVYRYSPEYDGIKNLLD